MGSTTWRTLRRALVTGLMMVIGTVVAPLVPASDLLPVSASGQEFETDAVPELGIGTHDRALVGQTDSREVQRCPLTGSATLAEVGMVPVSSGSTNCLWAIAKAGRAFLECIECIAAVADPSALSVLACINCIWEKIGEDQDVQDCWEQIKDWVRRRIGRDPKGPGGPGSGGPPTQ